MPAAGDLVFQIAADEKRLLDGIKRAESAAHAGGARIKGALSGGALSQASYGVQDFASVMMQGGERSLSRSIGAVTNNISMMGAAFGPWGLAVTTGVALLTQFGVGLYEASANAKKSSDTLKEYTAETDKLTASLTRKLEIDNRIRKLSESGSSKQVREATEDTKQQIAALKAEADLRSNRLTAATAERAMSGEKFTDEEKKANRAEVGRIDELNARRRMLQESLFEMDKAKGKAREREEEKRIAKEVAAFHKAADKEMREYRKETENRLREEQKQRQREEMQAFGERVEAIKRMEQETKTPEERFADRVQEIQTMLNRGDVTPQNAARALWQAREALPRQQVSQAALIEGSSAAVTAIAEAEIRQTQQQQVLDIQNKLLDEMRNAVFTLEEIKGSFEIQPVELR